MDTGTTNSKCTERLKTSSFEQVDVISMTVLLVHHGRTCVIRDASAYVSVIILQTVDKLKRVKCDESSF